MAGEMPAKTVPAQRVVDYDSEGYDYRGFWRGRDYERWAEARVLHRQMARLGQPVWFADFGGGYGRNAVHYRRIADHSVIVDYSVTNLNRAAELLADDIRAGRVHLIRSDLAALPLIDSGVECAMVVRVLHHLTDVDACLAEMGRTVARRWLVDVPIKHHLLGRLRSALHGRYHEVRSAEPLVTGSSEYPFSTYNLSNIRHRLEAAGWGTQLVASVNNFRRWDQVLPASAVRVLRPAVCALETLAQDAGRGWWGPSQFVLARRQRPRPAALRPQPDALAGSMVELARRLACPACGGDLTWSTDAAHCAPCDLVYPRRGEFWDFHLSTSMTTSSAATTRSTLVPTR